MNSESFAACFPTQIRLPKPYEPLRVEARRVGAIGCRVMVALPEINQTKRAFGNEHAFIPVVLGRGVRNT